MGVICFLLLSCLGLCITAQAQDCSRPVLGASIGLKGNDILLPAFPNGIRVALTCDVGYVSAGGSPFITCTDGTWSPVRLKCERKNCGEPFQVQNGHLTFPQGTEFGDTVQYSCDPGFILVGSDELTCGADGWIGREPTCEVVTCDPPPQIKDGAFIPDKDVYEYREVVRYTCTNGLDLVGSNAVSCSETGTWPDPPSCKRVQCSEPDIKNAVWVSGSRPPYKYKATVTYECRSGYKMEGSATLTCDSNNNWTPELPNCKQILTPAMPTTTATPPGRVLASYYFMLSKLLNLSGTAIVKTYLPILFVMFKQGVLCKTIYSPSWTLSSPRAHSGVSCITLSASSVCIYT
ncbi:uncharacterized protein V6R79_012434 [Siganus canaliculatus]